MQIVTPELARIYAHLCGDGSVFLYATKEKGRKFRGGAGYYNTNQQLLDNFRNDFSKIFNVKMKMLKGRMVTVSSIRIYNYLISRFGKFGSYQWRIPNEIKTSNSEIKINWLRAFFEDEAYHETKYNRLKTKSMNLHELEDAKELLDSLNIASTLTGPNCDKSYYLTIPKFSKVDIFSGFSKIPARKKNSGG